MKLSEMPLRDYIALEALPAIITQCAGDSRLPSQTIEELFVEKAYAVADATLAFMGKDLQEVRELVKRAEKAETQVSILMNMNEDGQFPARAALTQIWEALGANNQTEAMATIAKFTKLLEWAEQI